MIRRRAIAAATTLIAVNLIAGCAYPIRARGKIDSEIIEPNSWRGRLALQVAADAALKTPAQSLSAGFELMGTPDNGSLQLFTPLGSTAAAVNWSSTGALLQTPGETREFPTLSDLIDQLLGTSLPIAAFFGWLQGQTESAEGWQVDLSQKSQGKISAQRLTPAPSANLRIVLEE